MVAVTVHLKTVWGIFKIFFVCHKKILPCPFASCNLCFLFFLCFFLSFFIIYTKVHPGLFTKMSPKRFLGSLKNELEIFWFPELGLGVRLKKVEHTKDATWSVFLLQELVAWAEIPLLSSTDWTKFFLTHLQSKCLHSVVTAIWAFVALLTGHESGLSRVTVHLPRPSCLALSNSAGLKVIDRDSAGQYWLTLTPGQHFKSEDMRNREKLNCAY